MATFLDAHLQLLSQVASGAYLSPRCINLVFQVRSLGGIAHALPISFIEYLHATSLPSDSNVDTTSSKKERFV